MYTTTTLDQFPSTCQKLLISKSLAKKVFIQGSAHALSTFECLPEQGLAVVGTRQPQHRSIDFTRHLIRDLSDSGLIIISGLALGVDTVAHEAALEYGLRTIAVMGTGLDHTYPQKNQSLREKILKNDGIIVTQFSKDTPAKPWHFPKRNELVALLSSATTVIEASHRSGAINTANHAMHHQRSVFAVPTFPGDPALAGNQKLIDTDQASPLWGAHSLGQEWLELSTLLSQKRSSKNPSLDHDIEVLLEQIRLIQSREGQVTLSCLFDWATAQKWSSTRFFGSIRNGTLLKKIRYENELLFLSPEG